MSDKKDKIEDLTTINFSITKCPMRVFKRFSEFSKKESNDNYSFALKLLLDCRETNIKEVVLYEQYMELKQEFAELKKKVEHKTNKPKTMGSANKDKGEGNE